jgi:uncharacterized membrane protein
MSGRGATTMAAMYRLWGAPRGLIAAREGSVSILSVFLITIFLGGAATAVDYGSMVMRRQQLQGLADRAALASVTSGDATTATAQLIAAEGMDGVSLASAQTGSYVPDRSIAPAARFQPSATDRTAVRVVLRRRVPLFFAGVLTGKRFQDLQATATAARTGEAAIAIGSRLVSVQGGVPGALLSSLAGVNLNLSVADYNALVGANVDVLALSSLLKTRAGVSLGTFDSTATSIVDLPTLITAMADASSSSSAGAVLRQVALKVPPTQVDVRRLIDLGSSATPPAVSVAADALLREALVGTGGDRQVTLGLGVQVPGLASTNVRMAIGSRSATSPWIKVGHDATVTVSTAQVRLGVTARVDVLGVGLAAAELPVVIEGAGASARLAAITCGSGGATVDVDAQASPGRAMIASVSDPAFYALSTPLPSQYATLLSVPLTSIRGLADIQLGGTGWQRLTFSPTDIANGAVQTVNATSLTQGLVASLMQRLDIRINVLGIDVGTSPLTTPLLGALTGATPALDGLLDQVQQVAGIRVGQADVRVPGARCGTAALVS